MRSKFLIRTLGKAVLASALLSGVVTSLGSAVAHATGSITAFYVAPAGDGGNDGTGASGYDGSFTAGTNNCTLQATPCATIEQALSEEGTLSDGASGSVINLAKGTYTGAGNDFKSISASNNNVTINGAGIKGKKASVVEPTVCAKITGGWLANDYALVALNSGEDGITIQNMVLNGALAVSASDCSSYQAGVDINASTTGDAVVGDLIQSGTTYGILTDDNASSTIISNNLTPVLCTGKVTGPNTGLNAGWTPPANLKVKVPACAQFVESGHGGFTGVFINGIEYTATPSASKGTIVITGPSGHGVEIAKGATVVFNTSVAPFTQWGIACNSPADINNSYTSTTCALSDNTVTAGGTVYGDVPITGVSITTSTNQTCNGLPPIGIVATGGATANIDSNTVSNVADSISECPEDGEATSDGIGIGLIPNANNGTSAGNNTVVGVNESNNPATGDGNKLSGNDYGIVVHGSASSTSGTPPDPAYDVDGNTVSSANQEGILLRDLGYGYGHLSQTGFESNSVAGVLTGLGIGLEGVFGQNIGGPLKSDGNTSNGNGVGFVVAPCQGPSAPPSLGGGVGDPACESVASGDGAPQTTLPSNKNVVDNNTANSNELYGLLKIGKYQPEEIAGSAGVCPTFTGAPPTFTAGGDASCDNTFNDNTWTGNGAGAPSVNGANVMDGTGWGGGCGQEFGTGDCNGTSTLTYEGANASFPSTSNTTPFSLLVCNATATPMPLKAGTELTFYDQNNGDSGTFFVTSTTIAQPNDQNGVGTCNPDTYPYTSVSMQALDPAKVGTDTSPSGQPYILGTTNLITINDNGPTDVGNFDTYGSGAQSNSCTPDYTASSAPLNIFGTTNESPNHPSSTTLDAGTGGVNATYDAC